jgi:propionate CoA-transferase
MSVRGWRAPGGSINISQNAKKLVFIGTFTAGRLSLAVENGNLRIVNDGKVAKFVREVEHRTFSGSYATRRGQPVLHVTERCVFKLTPDGLELIEVAPGIDLERDILVRMDFRPIVRNPAVMDKRIFAPRPPMGLRDRLLRMPIERRLTYHAGDNLFFVNFEGHRVRNHEDVEEVRRAVESKLAGLGHKVHAIVNYDKFEIFPDIIDEYMAMVRGLFDQFYSG